MKALVLPVLMLALVILPGCASRHPYMAKPASLGSPHYNADGDLVQNWQPSQLTPAGCVLHTIVTFGHVAQECRYRYTIIKEKFGYTVRCQNGIEGFLLEPDPKEATSFCAYWKRPKDWQNPGGTWIWKAGQ